jgi:hypothetical protein
MHARHDLDPSESVFPEIPGDETRFRLLTLYVRSSEVRPSGRLGATSESDVVRR